MNAASLALAGLAVLVLPGAALPGAALPGRYLSGRYLSGRYLSDRGWLGRCWSARGQPDGRRAGLVRLRALCPPPRRVRDRRRWDPPTAAAVLTAATVALLAGGLVGVACGLGAALVIRRAVRRLEPAAVRRARALRQAELPLALDLLAQCLSAGLPMSGALDAVGPALRGPLAGDLALVAGLCRLGVAPAGAWAEVTADPALGPVARAVTRTAESGTALADTFQRMSAEARSEAQLRAEAWARRAGVLAMAPLGLCFLPAFVCLGVVPVILGIATQVLG